jgi:hypothetical protein
VTIEFPTYGGDQYEVAKDLGKLARELGQTMIEQVGSAEARLMLENARHDEGENA